MTHDHSDVPHRSITLCPSRTLARVVSGIPGLGGVYAMRELQLPRSRQPRSISTLL